MKYPALKNLWLRRSEVENYLDVLDNDTGEEILCALRLDPEFGIASKLNGSSDPYNIRDLLDPAATYPKEIVDATLQNLEEQNLLRHSRLSWYSIWDFSWSLLILPCKSRRMRNWGRLIHYFSAFFWLPILISGMVLFPFDQVDFLRFNHLQIDVSSLAIQAGGIAVGLITGNIAHELGHFVSSLTLNGALFELRIRIRHLIPRLETLFYTTNVHSPLMRFQAHVAGIENNLLTTGIFLILGAKVPTLLAFSFLCAFANLLYASIAILPFRKCDGYQLLSALMDVCFDDFEELLSPDQVFSFVSSGPKGVLTIVAGAVIEVGTAVLKIFVILLICLEVFAVLCR